MPRGLHGETLCEQAYAVGSSLWMGDPGIGLGLGTGTTSLGAGEGWPGI